MTLVRNSLTAIVLFLLAAAMLQAQETTSARPHHPGREWNSMGSVPCAWSGPVAKTDGSVDEEGTIQWLHANGFRCNVFVMRTTAPNDWVSFQKLVPAADAVGIDLWPVLIPPSEGADSHPYGADYISWAKALAKLSLRYPHLRGFNIDDIDRGVSPNTFTRSYLCQIYRAKQTINPRLQFVPTIYDLDTSEADRLAGCVDGAWLWWVNLEKATGLSSFLENSRLAVKGRFPIYGGVYAQGTSWHKSGEPLPKVFQETLEDTCRYADGAVIYLLSLQKNDPLLAITESFTEGGSSPYAGKCGTNVSSLASKKN